MKKVFVTWDDVQRQTQEILRQMQRDNWLPDYIVGITRGGLTPANLLSQFLDVKMFTLDVRLRDGDGEVESNLWMSEEAFGYNNQAKRDIPNARWDPACRKKILIVDDINDSGATINWIKQDWESSCSPGDREECEDVWNVVWGNTVRFAVLYDNLASESELDTNYSAQEINKIEDPSWIVFPWEEWWKRWDPNEEIMK